MIFLIRRIRLDLMSEIVISRVIDHEVDHFD